MGPVGMIASSLGKRFLAIFMEMSVLSFQVLCDRLFPERPNMHRIIHPIKGIN